MQTLGLRARMQSRNRLRSIWNPRSHRDLHGSRRAPRGSTWRGPRTGHRARHKRSLRQREGQQRRAEDPECQAYPACAAGDFQFDECPPDTDCAAVTGCGFTIYCVTPACAPQWACAANEAPVPALCDSEGCVLVESCGVPAVCVNTDLATCAAEPPDCLDGWVEVSACDPGDPRCMAMPGCSRARLCVPADECDAPPTCPSGVVSDGCGPDGPCEQRVACSEVLFCVGADGG